MVIIPHFQIIWWYNTYWYGNGAGNTMEENIASSPWSKSTSCHHQGDTGRKTLLQQNPRGGGGGCRLIEVVLCIGHKTVVVVVVQGSLAQQRGTEWGCPLLLYLGLSTSHHIAGCNDPWLWTVMFQQSVDGCRLKCVRFRLHWLVVFFATSKEGHTGSEVVQSQLSLRFVALLWHRLSFCIFRICMVCIPLTVERCHWAGSVWIFQLWFHSVRFSISYTRFKFFLVLLFAYHCNVWVS